MVSKKRNPPPAPPKPKEDSSEEEVEEEENEEDEVEEEEAKAEEEESEESKEDETESEEENPESNNEESDSPTPSPSTVKPPVTVPGKTRTSNSISKRPLESSNYTINGSRNQKRAKTIKQNYKRGNRTWSEENETVLLQGMIDFKKQNGSFPGIAVFYEFIKGKLLKGFTKPQIDDKLRKLMNKYSNPHEINMFNLSQQIWGDGIEIQIEHEKSKGGNDDVDEEIFKKFPTLINYIDEELGFLKDNIHSIGIGNAVKLEENWKELQIKDMDVLAKKLNMRSEQIKLVLNAMKKKKKQQ